MSHILDEIQRRCEKLQKESPAYMKNRTYHLCMEDRRLSAFTQLWMERYKPCPHGEGQQLLHVFVASEGLTELVPPHGVPRQSLATFGAHQPVGHVVRSIVSRLLR